MSTLFRPEALAHRRDRLQGEVIVLLPTASRWLTLLLLAIVAAVVALLLEVSYARKETVRGYLVSSRGLAKVYAPAAGTIVEVYVQEGQQVALGDPLLGIRHERVGAGGTSTQAQILTALQGREAATRERIALAAAQVAARQQAIDSDISALSEQITALRRRHQYQLELMQLVQADLNDLEKLRRQSVATTSALRDKQRELVLQQRDAAELAQELALLEGQLAERRHQLTDNTLRNAQTLADYQSELHALAEQRARIEGERYTLLTAAVAGQVAALYASIGQDIDTDTPQLAILPDGGELLAELFVPTRAIGFVAPGQEARLLYEAFPYQRFGSASGTVERLTTTIIAPQDLPGPLHSNEPVYRVTVRLPAQTLDVRGESYALQAGMLLQAHLILERRPLLAWLLGPFAALRQGV